MASGIDPADDARSAKPPVQAPATEPARVEPWLDMLFETSPIAIGVVNTFDNRYLRANPAMAELYGMSIEEILQSDPFSIAMRMTHPDDLVAEQKLFSELTSGVRSSYTIEKRFLRADGSWRSGYMTFAGMFDPPPVPGQAPALRLVVLQIVDTTAQRALADALRQREEELRHAQKVDGIGRLTAGIAHDFNNLLTVIIGHGEVLRRALGRADAGQPQGVHESLDAILAACDRAASLTTQLLAHGRRGPVAPRVLALSSTVAALQQLLGRTLGPSLEIVQSPSAAGSIFADEGQVTQVVLNLVLNARDAMPDGGRIRLSTQDVVVAETAQDESPPGSGKWVALSVTDSGHGMSGEVQARMFEPFFTTRADRPGTQGTGLGLSTVKRIVTDAGGHIGVESAPGAGTTVTVYFPGVDAVPRSSAPPRPSTRPAPAPNTVRILVVEDEPSVRSLLANVLVSAHYWVMVARDGQEALRFIDREPVPFDLIVADLIMPAMGGLALAESLRRRGTLPRVLFVSGYSEHAPADLLPYGKLLPKPFTPEQLLTAVSTALDAAD